VNVLLVAEEAAGIGALKTLATTEHHVVAALTTEPTRGGGATVETVARALGVPTLPSERVLDPATAGWIASEEVDLLLNVHSLHVVHESVVAAPRIGSFNVHPGPLPEYAGLNAPSWAIYAGEPRHAVTVHWMEAGIDTGPIAYSSSFELTDGDTGLSVAMRCAREAQPLVATLLEAAADDPASIPRLPQDVSRRRYYGRRVPNDGAVDWSAPARRVLAFVRACDYTPFPSPWGSPWAFLGDRRIEVVTAAATRDPCVDVPPGTVGGVSAEGARIATCDDWILVLRVRLDDVAVDAATVLRTGDQLRAA
jgi:UDP-4-amino-4-deoxy-L-arabinose formyltransferase/UDP-glucuronic acid dehydrogenase (UDP-4-keto-hexauronic acid decarboxylating)